MLSNKTTITTEKSDKNLLKGKQNDVELVVVVVVTSMNEVHKMCLWGLLKPFESRETLNEEKRVLGWCVRVLVCVLSRGLICLMLCNLWRLFPPVCVSFNSLLIDRSIDVNKFGFYRTHIHLPNFFMDFSF